MRSLVQFLWRFHHIFLFLFLETIAISLLVSYNNYQQASFLNMTNEVSGGAFAMVTNVSDYIELKEQNLSLLRENAKLRSQLKSAHFQLTAETTFTIDTVFNQQYQYVGGRVINRSVNRQNNSITIDIGSEHGVEIDMGVIGPDGVIGIVRSVSPHFSAVLPILHSQARISTKILKSGYFGILQWDGGNPQMAQLQDIPNFVIIGEGDSLVTDGASALFPQGIPVGTIEGFSQQSGSNYYKIDVKLATDFKKVNYAYVIKNLLKGEQRKLEEGIIDE